MIARTATKRITTERSAMNFNHKIRIQKWKRREGGGQDVSTKITQKDKWHNNPAQDKYV